MWYIVLVVVDLQEGIPVTMSQCTIFIYLPVPSLRAKTESLLSLLVFGEFPE